MRPQNVTKPMFAMEFRRSVAVKLRSTDAATLLRVRVYWYARVRSFIVPGMAFVLCRIYVPVAALCRTKVGCHAF